MAFSRSTFVKLAGAFAGSLVLAIGDQGDDAAASTVDPGAPGGFSPNVWLRIDPDDTVTVTINKSEMGQGVATGLPTLVAEELDVPFARVRVTFADAAQRYVYAGGAAMSTGGSTSMRDSWLPLRHAGASARAMLISAAAKQWHVDPTRLTTTDGVVIDAAGNQRATYGSLVAAAAALPVPEHVPLKDPQRFRLIGNASTLRPD
ncbi:MAG TPA: molybdopterin cofactor-binding domain-containing protein, partial [Candidatus Acidoferrum sp.]|nr:molybdopterin cofactor-binding domain-containing protein [Candidatus Acidoferrum sp.]